MAGTATPLASAQLAAVLQLADSGFPSGAFTCSWGLEGLAATGEVHDARSLEAFVVDQLRHRWATFDRVVVHLVATATMGNDPLDAVAELDRLVDAMSLPPAQRDASRAAGSSYLRNAAMVVDDVSAWHRDLDRVGSPMHLSVTQPLVLLTVGAPVAMIEVVSGMQTVQQLVSAGLRLGLIGHLGAQRLTSRSREELDRLSSEPPDARPSQFVPRAELAMYRHPRLPGRSFRC